MVVFRAVAGRTEIVSAGYALKEYPFGDLSESPIGTRYLVHQRAQGQQSRPHPAPRSLNARTVMAHPLWLRSAAVASTFLMALGLALALYHPTALLGAIFLAGLLSFWLVGAYARKNSQH